MPVTQQHTEYGEMLPIWRANRDAIAGQDAIKKGGKLYLPMPESSDWTVADYDAYKTRAVFTNYTGRTIYGLLGMANNRPPQITLPDQIDYLFEDANMVGVKLEALGQRAISEVLTAGRFIFVADYTGQYEGDEIPTAEQSGQNRSFIASYVAEDLINWKTKDGILTLAVFREVEDEAADEFDTEFVNYYQVYRLIDGRAYYQRYREETPITEMIPVIANGYHLEYLPIFIAGAIDNNETSDMPPITDIANLNIAHYRNSADYEEGVFIASQPMLHINIGNTSSMDWQELNPNGVAIGARRGITTEGGSVDLIQAQANTMGFEAMQQKEAQMIQLGAQIITPKSGNETVEAAKMRASTETSILNTVVNNVSDAIEQALYLCALYEGMNDPEIEFKLNTKFFDDEVNPQLVMAAIQLQDRGVIAKSDIRSILRKGKIIEHDRLDEEIDTEAESII
jgi:hypothetical protein